MFTSCGKSGRSRKVVVVLNKPRTLFYHVVYGFYSKKNTTSVNGFHVHRCKQSSAVTNVSRNDGVVILIPK
jgi:hypothetical protein